MCSIVAQTSGSTGSRLVALVERFGELGAEIAAMLRDPAAASDTAGLPVDSLASLVASLLSTGDSASAVATVLAGHLDSRTGRATGVLVAGRYASTHRFLEVEGGLSKQRAIAMVARARDLRDGFAVLSEPWLEGRISGDAVREVTVGIRGALKRSGLPGGDREVARKSALDVVLPVAEVGTVEDVRRVIGHLTLLADPDGATQAEMDAFDDQSLTMTRVGAVSTLTAVLTHETAAAVMTVLTQKVDAMRRGGELTREDQLRSATDPGTFGSRGVRSQRYAHLLAVAFGDTFVGLLDDNRVGSHHGIAPHVTVTVDLARFEAGLGGDLTMPGSDTSVLLPSQSVRRILCDSDVTTVVVRPSGAAGSDRCGSTVGNLLLEASREVLYVGRAERVVPPRLRRALEARDGHCRFPGCQAHVRRCHAHHVLEWENGGSTDIDNCVLLCVRHHHAVHEGGWTLSRAPGIPPGGTGHWQFAPPERRRRPR